MARSQKEIFASNLKHLLDIHDLAQVDVAKAIGVSPQTFNTWVKGVAIPRMGKIQVLADYFGVLKSELVDDNPPSLYGTYGNIMPIKTKKIPLLGEIVCGEPIYADQDFESYVEVGTDIRADFALRASGNSMIGARIKDGDIVFVRKQDIVEPGEIAAVIIEGEATLKRVYYQEGNRLILQAENSAYPPMIYEADKLNQITILGKAISFQSDVR
ncbi:LexA family protein [Peptococcus niger]|uniref:Repressor LexA n=1 Tax=Peptococcus niger TaxID=2741 RepID=A0A1G6TQM1_PEPNI|nr:LexA family transcriptional regulator [Peptococcus niger]SDD31403.1 repressor LexA [Peptococcus niger]